jgi:hypothetical protein
MTAIGVARVAEVDDLENTMLVEKDIGRLQVPMQYFVLFQMQKSFEQLSNDAFGMLVFEFDLALQH